MNTPANKAATIRPGLLVNLKSTVVGGVSYRRVDLDASGEPVEPGAAVARWETIRVIEDEAEYERATKARSKATSLITRECQSTAFGDLCPESHEGALDAAYNAARAIVDEHNATAVHTRVQIYMLKGRVASNDAEAARAITSEVADLVVAMNNGISALDATAIRKAADRAREISAMLDDSIKGKVEGAIEQARKAARTIVKRIEKEGEDKAIVLMDIQRGAIESARIMFLDLSESLTVAPLPAVEAQRFADLDMPSDDDDDTSSERAPVAARPALDFDDSEIKVAARASNVPAMELL